MIQSAADRAYFVAIHVVLAEPAKPCTTAVSREHGDRALWRDGAGRARDRGRPRRPGPVWLRRSASLATARRSGWGGGGRARGRRAHPDRHAVLSVGTRSSCELSGPARATDGARDRDPGAGVVDRRGAAVPRRALAVARAVAAGSGVRAAACRARQAI